MREIKMPKEFDNQVSKYMSEIGKKGGSVKSEQKAAAVIENGKKGGRPSFEELGRMEKIKADIEKVVESIERDYPYGIHHADYRHEVYDRLIGLGYMDSEWPTFDKLYDREIKSVGVPKDGSGTRFDTWPFYARREKATRMGQKPEFDYMGPIACFLEFTKYPPLEHIAWPPSDYMRFLLNTELAAAYADKATRNNGDFDEHFIEAMNHFGYTQAVIDECYKDNLTGLHDEITIKWGRLKRLVPLLEAELRRKK